MKLLKGILVAILTLEARLIVKKYKPFVVAVTGSVGKTSTKDAIFDVLKRHKGRVRKSEKSMNSEIGLPLTIIGVGNAWKNLSGWLSNIGAGLRLILTRSSYPEVLVLEVGADHPGDIESVTKWLRPDVSVITLISKVPVHVEFFASPEAVFKEKSFLATGVKNGGTLVLFGDDERVMTMKDLVKDRNVSIVSYGTQEGVTVRGESINVLYEDGAPVGIGAEVCVASERVPMSVKGIVGDTYMYPILAAVAVGKACGVDVASSVKDLQSYEMPRGRMNVIPGINGSTLIDDSYNSSPDAVVAAFNTLKKLECSGRKVAVLGDMMELGKFAGAEHRKVGKEVVQGIDMLVTVGQRSRLTSEEARSAGMDGGKIHSFDTSREAAQFLATTVATGDIILVKGSQSMRMERISSALLREPQKAAKLLVRQEREWLAKE